MYGNVPGQSCKRCGMPLPPNQVRCPRCGFDAPVGQSNPQSLAGGLLTNQTPPGMTSSPNSMAGFPSTGQNWQVSNPNSFQGIPGPNGQNTQPPSFPGIGQRAQSTSLSGVPGVGSSYAQPQSFPGIAGRNPQAPSLPSTPTPGQNMRPVSFSGVAGAENYVPRSASLVGMTRSEQRNTPSSLNNVDRPQQPSTDTIVGKTKRKGKGRTILLTLLLVLMVMVAATSGYVLFTSITAGKAVNRQPVTHVMNPYPSLKVQPLFGDFFRDNSSQWDLDSQAGKYTAKIGGGNLTLQDANNTVLPEFLPTSQPFSNFKLLVDAEQVSGNAKNGYGVYIRASVNQQGMLTTYYRLELYGDGTYAIFKGMLDANGNPNPNAVKIVSYTPDAAVHKEGTVNHITVVANGSSITFIANNQPLYAFSDSAYTSGSIALFVSNPQDVPAGVVANFSKLAVFPLS